MTEKVAASGRCLRHGSAGHRRQIGDLLEGTVEPAGRVRTRSKALQFILDRIPEGRVEAISVLHAMAPDVDEFVERLEPKVPGAEVVVGAIGPVIGVHTGPRVLGVAYIAQPG